MPDAKKAVGGGDHDRVVMVSRRPDGSSAQTTGDDFEIIGDKQVAIDGAKQQLREQAVSAKDVELRGAAAATGAAGSSEPDAAVKKLIDAHEAAAKAGEAAGESDVNAHFVEAKELQGEAASSEK